MSYLCSNEEVVAAYVDLRDRMIPLLRTLPEDVVTISVPHCPAWTVQETVAHMVGVPDALLSGDLDGIASDAWTQRQVERHKGLSLKQLADKWEAQAEDFFVMLPNIPQPALSQMMFDVTSHEHDVRHAVGQPGGRESAGVTVGIGFIKNLIDMRKSLDASVIDDWTVKPFDVFRILGGRRSIEQIIAAGVDVEFVKEVMRPLPISIPEVSIAE